MKKTIPAILFLLLALAAPAAEIRGLIGINWNKYLFSEEINYVNHQSKGGTSFGLGWALPLNRNLALEIETLLSRRGAKTEIALMPGRSIPCVYENTSVGVPVLFKYRLRERATPYAAAGPEFGFILAHTLSFDGRNEDIMDNTKKFIVAFTAALGYELPVGDRWGVFVEARYNRSFSDLWRSPDAAVKNESMSLLLGGAYSL